MACFINGLVAGQSVIGSQRVAQVVLARDRLLLLLGFRMTAQIDRQANTAQSRDLAGPGQVLLLAAAPAVQKQHPRHRLLPG